MIPASNVSPRPILIYLLGASRSGSTVLDALLGSHPDIVATGELYHMLKSDHGSTRYCACNAAVVDCEFWGPVLKVWQSRTQGFSPAEYLRLQGRFERFRDLPRMAREAVAPSRDFLRYVRWTQELLLAIQEVAQVSRIADSSKHPPRLLPLVLSREFDIRVVHIVRDPRGVAWSKVKFLRAEWGPSLLNNAPSIAVRTAIDWVGINRISEWLGRSMPDRYVRVRYEDFVDDPRVQLGRIGAALGVDFSDEAARAAAGDPLRFGHIVAGNRTRFRAARGLAKDTDWQENSPRWMRRLVWILTGPLAHRYGYQSESSSSPGSGGSGREEFRADFSPH